MAKLNYSNIDISRDVLPSLATTIDRLDDLILVNEAMYIPGNFNYADFLVEYREFINNSKIELQGIEEWLKKSNKAYDKANNLINEDLSAIPIEEVLERGNLVS